MIRIICKNLLIRIIVRSNLKIHLGSKGSILKERKKERLMQELNFIGWTATEGMEANHDCTILWYKKSMLGVVMTNFLHNCTQIQIVDFYLG